jgi:SrtB family sortase
LNHAIDRKKDVKGSEFMDYRIKPTSKQVNIYGHNSKTYDIPFRKLEKFLDKDFFDSTPYVLLQHDTGTRIYKIFSLKEISKDYEHMVVSTTIHNHKQHIDILKEGSLYTRDIPYDENSNILVLQTCSYTKSNTYYVISAIEIK